MSETATPEMKQTRMNEFVRMLPLTLEIAGLPKANPTQLFTADQMEARIMSIRTAYKLARNLIRDVGETGG